MKMKEKLERALEARSKENVICFLFALIATVIVFSVFVGQGLFSDVVTFAKAGDADKQTFAAFMKIRQCLLNGENLVGVDSGSFNASTEFFLRPNMPVAYIWFYVFAVISIVFPPRAMFVLFYMCHMFAGLYLIQRLSRKYFGLNNGISIVVASMFLTLLCGTSWYVSHFIVATLSVVLFYFSLEYFYHSSVRNFLKLMLAVIMAATAGYIVTACFLIVGIYIFSLVYICAEKEDRTIRKIAKYTIPYVCAGVVLLLYLLSVFLYVKKVVAPSTSLTVSANPAFNLNDLYNVVSSFAFTATSVHEFMPASLGFIACIVLGYAVADGAIGRLGHRDQIFVKLNFVVWFVLIIWSTEASTALAGWLYSFLPVFGSMHLPCRYMMVTNPCLYISIGMLCKNVDWDKYSKSVRGLAAFLCGILAVYLLLVKAGLSIPFIHENRFAIECMITIAFLLVLGKNKPEFHKERYIWLIALWSFSLCIQGATILYGINGIYESPTSMENRSIIYNRAAISTIDNYITATGNWEKEEYRIVAYDSSESVPAYLLGNYEWYGYSEYSLCNYSGYEPHLCTPSDYHSKHGWFNIFDWEYLVNTRADYMLTDQATLDADRAFFDRVIDWDKGVADIGNGRIMVSLYKFIPSIICGTPYVYEDKDSLDNGFFYSHDLNNHNISSFHTDENSYYEMTIHSENPSVIAFLPYANRYYQYYVDGIRYNKEVINMQAVIRLDSGEHTIRIVYENRMGKLGFYFIMVTAGILILLILFFEIREICISQKRALHIKS